MVPVSPSATNFALSSTFCSVIVTCDRTANLYIKRSPRAWKSEYRRVTSDLKLSDLTLYSTCLRMIPFFCGTGSIVIVSSSSPGLRDPDIVTEIQNVATAGCQQFAMFAA